MSIKEFAEAVRARVAEITGKEVEVREVPKNNGVILHGIVVAGNEDNNMVPAIYIEGYWEEFKIHEDIEKTVSDFMAIYNSVKDTKEIDLSWFTDFDIVKEKVVFKLVNYASNRIILNDVPHTKYLDLAKVYYVNFIDKELGAGTILIRNRHLKEWGVTVEQLEELAAVNTPKLNPLYVLDINEILERVCTGITENMDEDELEDMRQHYPMYAITNEKKDLGAFYLCDKSIFKEYADKLGCDIIILPSSIHEVLIVPMECNMDVDRFKEIVREVNNTQVNETEVLSYSVYVYSRENDSITVA